MPNTIILRGDQYTLREDLSIGAVTPGHLVEFDSTNGQIQKHSTSNGKAAATFAVENSIIGNGATTAYISGDRVRYADCAPGIIIWAFLASGENVKRGAFLSSDGAGALHAYAGTAPPIAEADENADATVAGTTTAGIRFRARVV